MVDPNVKNGIFESGDIAPAPLLAKIIAAKPNTALRIVISDGRIVIYFNLCLRTRRSRLFRVDLVFNFGIVRISKFVFYKRRKARFYFIACLHDALGILTDREIQLCSGAEFYHTKPLSTS